MKKLFLLTIILFTTLYMVYYRVTCYEKATCLDVIREGNTVQEIQLVTVWDVLIRTYGYNPENPLYFFLGAALKIFDVFNHIHVLIGEGNDCSTAAAIDRYNVSGYLINRWSSGLIFAPGRHIDASHYDKNIFVMAADADNLYIIKLNSTLGENNRTMIEDNFRYYVMTAVEGVYVAYGRIDASGNDMSVRVMKFDENLTVTWWNVIDTEYPDRPLAIASNGEVTYVLYESYSKDSGDIFMMVLDCSNGDILLNEIILRDNPWVEKATICLGDKTYVALCMDNVTTIIALDNRLSEIWGLTIRNKLINAEWINDTLYIFLAKENENTQTLNLIKLAPDGTTIINATWNGKLSDITAATTYNNAYYIAGTNDYGNKIELHLIRLENDSDLDGLSDNEEKNIGTDPHNSDTDSDGMPDGWEYVNNLDPLDPTDATQDNDGDGLDNKMEYIYGTDPTDPDTDGDGYSDGYEVSHGTDPLDPNDYPVPFIRRYWWVLVISIASIVVLVVFLHRHRVSVRKVES